jgi:hypothetical protein
VLFDRFSEVSGITKKAGKSVKTFASFAFQWWAIKESNLEPTD